MKKGLFILLGGMLLLFIGLVAFGQGRIDFDPTTYNPAVGEGITFSVCPDCSAGAAGHYEWDFDGDGISDLSTRDPSVTHTFATPGYQTVTLKLVGSGGRVMERRKGILVGRSPLIGVRRVEEDGDGSIRVVITILAAVDLSGVGIEETIPVGWQVSASKPEGAFVKRTGRRLQALWLNQLEQGAVVSFSYTLYPAQGNGVPTFAGTISGYSEGKRVENELCGDVTLPR